METVSYRAPGPNRVVLLGMFGAFFLAAIFVLSKLVAHATAPMALFVAAWLAALALNGYFWLWRISFRLVATGDDLTWTTPLHHGVTKVGDILSVTQHPLVGQLATVKVSDGRRVLVPIGLGLTEFANELQRSSPRIYVGHNLDGRDSGILIRRNGFQREP